MCVDETNTLIIVPLYDAASFVEARPQGDIVAPRYTTTPRLRVHQEFEFEFGINNTPTIRRGHHPQCDTAGPCDVNGFAAEAKRRCDSRLGDRGATRPALLEYAGERFAAVRARDWITNGL